MFRRGFCDAAQQPMPFSRENEPSVISTATAPNPPVNVASDFVSDSIVMSSSSR